MFYTTIDNTYFPPNEVLDDLMDVLAEPSGHAVAEPSFLSSNGTTANVPTEVLEVLQKVIAAMKQGQAVTISSVDMRLDEHQAASLIGERSSFFSKLLDDGTIPSTRTQRLRMIQLRDLLEYQERSARERREAFERMQEAAHEGDMYRKTATPVKTR